ncbi:hypothetical protein BUALT_Bualt07G0018600 [Buddleja alternifolia]|uniref:Uncharacterized protein n=1 Tax=Buddleja alternifolia TaxID=168488 RepID=A0AAV6XHY2_9LAMI|nr:hypothetical protein BUALT_Bualt07G0018600 [Buddleja alternifolia]
MADPAVSFLLENLKQFVTYYAHLISGAENELQNLENELASLKAFLNDASNMRKKNELFKEIERQIREVVHYAEDTIDSCLIQAAATKAKNPISRLFSRKRITLAEEVQSLREQKVTSMVNKATNFGNNNISDGSGSSAEEEWTKMDKAAIRQDDIVGFHDQEEVLIGYLKEKKDELDVISIIGSPGQGKTTLALKIYRDERIKDEFDIRIWIDVSQDFNLDDLFHNIVEIVATSKDISNLSHTKNLAVKVHDCLEGVKFLLVLDDIWSVEAWKAIQRALPKKNNLGKVLITSRDDEVGKHANVNREPHKLRKLDDEECWQLLKLEVFGKQKQCPSELQSIGRYVASQCNGLPLKVLVMGGILFGQFGPARVMAANVEAWKNVAKDVRNYVESSVVSLSYKKMSDDLRECFLYLGVFPEDYKIRARTLTRLWIAEGFIQAKEGQSLEETAQKNLEDLISMNLVTVEKTYISTGEVKTCCVHDEIRTFCISKAAVREQNLFKEIKLTKEGVFDPKISGKEKYRRLCIHLHLAKFLSEKPVGLGVRSFLCFYREACTLDPELISFIPKSFKLLRVLDVMSTKLTEFPTKLSKLIHLRYITLSFQDLEFLPKSISELRFLQTLIVDTTKSTLRIEANIWNMFQLRHLITKASIKLVVQGESIDAGKDLQTLCSLSPEFCTDDVFNRARNLKKLGIRGPLNAKLDFNPLERLDHLENLKLLNDMFSGAARENPLRRLPQHNNFPRNLKKLTMSATYLDWRHMSTLGMVVTLQVLKLIDNAFTGDSWDVVPDGFRRLQFLLIASTDLVHWKASDHDEFPSLGCLVLNCEKLFEIPSGLARRNGLDIQWKQRQEMAGWI